MALILSSIAINQKNDAQNLAEFFSMLDIIELSASPDYSGLFQKKIHSDRVEMQTTL